MLLPTNAVPMPLAELADRYTITVLKRSRLPHEHQDALQAQIAYYEQGLQPRGPELQELLDQLFEINGLMWDAEHAIRKGLDDDLPLDEIGRRALKIRDLNKARITVKNNISRLTGRPEFVDVKMNYA